MIEFRQTVKGSQSWSRRPRVLVEDPDPVLAVSDFAAFRDAGFDVTVCSGPVASPCECALLRDGRCELLDSCDVLVFGLPRSTLGSQSVLRDVRRVRPELPVVLRDPVEDDSLARGCVVVPRATSVAGQLRALRTALS